MKNLNIETSIYRAYGAVLEEQASTLTQGPDWMFPEGTRGTYYNF